MLPSVEIDFSPPLKYPSFEAQANSRRNRMFPHLGMGELLVILVIVVFIFGVNKIPQLGKGLGEGIKNFKSALKEGEQEPDDKREKQ
jgi:sec-independent protein translocase protein TatA